MTERDDDDDPQLKSLRAVWLDMRDEDPPERGLAELMAAARVKASELREPEPRPSWWQRFAALLRKPPVLALTSAMVLLGGVVLIGSRGEKMHAEAPSLRADQADQPAPGTYGSPTAGQDRVAEPAAIAAPTDEQGHIEGNRGEVGPSEAVRGEAVRGEAAPAPASADPLPAPARKQPARRTGPSPARDTDLVTETLDDEAMYRREEARAFESELAPRGLETPSEAGTARGPTTGTTTGTRGAAPQTGDATQPSRTTQFLAEAKAAATRGDCARAQTWLKRLAAEDSSAYRKAVASDASLRKCLAE